jgi:hypothetical protein
MRGALPPLPPYLFMAWCLVKHRDNFTFTFIFKSGVAFSDMMSIYDHYYFCRIQRPGVRVQWLAISIDFPFRLGHFKIANSDNPEVFMFLARFSPTYAFIPTK